MSRTRLFIENFIAYGLINVLDKIVPLLLLPFITRLLTDPSDFGVYDMYNLIIGFGVPLAVLGMYDAMFREYFEKDDLKYRHDITTTANRIVLTASVFICIIFIVFNSSFSKLFFGTSVYGTVIVFSAIGMIISANKAIISAPTRIQNKRAIYMVSGILSSLLYYGLAILLIYLGYSYFGLIYANIISAFSLLIFFLVLNRNFFTLGKFDKNIAKELLRIGLPLLPVFLIYWIYNSMDRIMLANMLGTADVGIYAVGAKIASISTFIYAAFAGGWQYFAFSTMKDEDQVALNSKVFEYLGAISFLSLIVLYPLIKPLFNWLFPASYSGGAVVVPYLYISPLLLMLFQVVGNQFLVIKKSYWSTITLTIGAFANVLLNWVLIPLMGVEGAAIATSI
ncbi:MAG: oligosaccharide flippase family protein, partial [Clostridiales bacterium]|nr:oligosaccharide flippase family protein [Clostridiales bacterium]